MYIRPHGVGQRGQRRTRLVAAAVAGLQQHGLCARHIQRVAVVAADIAVQLRRCVLCGRHGQRVPALIDRHAADISAEVVLRQHAVCVGGCTHILTAVPCQRNGVGVRKLVTVLHREAGDRAVLHDAVDDDVIRHRHIVAGIVKQLLAGGVIQCVGVRRAAVAADELPDDGLCRQLRAVRVHIEAVIAAVAVGHGQRHGVPLVPAQAAPTGGGVAQIAAGRANGWLHAIGRHRYARIISGKVFQLCTCKRAPLRHGRFVLMVTVLVTAADRACDRGCMGGHDGQTHDCY